MHPIRSKPIALKAAIAGLSTAAEGARLAMQAFGDNVDHWRRSKPHRFARPKTETPAPDGRTQRRNRRKRQRAARRVQRAKR